ncbi:alpha/beta fold hydrolase [Gillisia hiemivivida]|uniref:Alpha/beta hydrolase n=1 Tax=Gillisia hiemivivida TaxID=291190 RepID=A0A5C6ZV12_9FLAO|nr:alpha/beta hydrolase [Gillisia hiemivivida]TXD92685.1 alpha/beta hydrolase [Gillisia hiemivivida]
MKTFKILCLVLVVSLTQSIQSQEAFQVEVSGTGQPVLLFPGFTSTGEVFNNISETLAKNHEVHTFTFAGFGGVAAIEKPWFPKIKKAVETYISENDLKNPIVIGHSMGGTLGLWLAADHPKLFSKLIIIDALPAMGALMIPNYNSDNMVYDNPYNQQMLEMNDEGFEKMATQMATSMSNNKEKHQQLKDWIIETDRKTYVYGYTDLLKLDLREDLSKIETPVVLLGATYPYGKEVAEKNYKDQYENLKNYSLRFAEGSGHFIMYDAPIWFAEQIKSELDL